MKTITLEEYGKDSDNIHKRVEKGEKIAVTDGQVSVVLTPSDEYVRMPVSYTHLRAHET